VTTLDTPTLVLNKHWAAITTTPVRQALILVFRAAARVICPESYEIYDLEGWLSRSAKTAPTLARSRVIRSPGCSFEVPEVILLSVYGGIPRMEVAFSRRNLYRRDGLRCQYCNSDHSTSDLSIDHVMPRSRGGKTSWENCVLACVRCNTKKANRTPKESGLPLRRKPRRPSWSPLTEIVPQARPPSWARFLRSQAAG
jgi:5-methylcytosine-specific restriction endonuclease McrA